MSTLVWLVVCTCGLIAGFATLLTNWHTIRQKLGKYHSPTSSPGIHVQMWGGFELLPASDGTKPSNDATSVNTKEYGYPSMANPYYSDPGCFSTASVEFNLTNKNDIDVVIDEMAVDVMRHPSPKFHIGMGPLISNAEKMTYEVKVGKHARTSKCVPADKNKYFKLAPGEAQRVRIYLRYEGEGYISIRPNYTYTIGGITATAKHPNYSPKVFFFNEVPPGIH